MWVWILLHSKMIKSYILNLSFLFPVLPQTALVRFSLALWHFRLRIVDSRETNRIHKKGGSGSVLLWQPLSLIQQCSHTSFICSVISTVTAWVIRNCWVSVGCFFSYLKHSFTVQLTWSKQKTRLFCELFVKHKEPGAFLTLERSGPTPPGLYNPHWCLSLSLCFKSKVQQWCDVAGVSLCTEQSNEAGEESTSLMRSRWGSCDCLAWKKEGKAQGWLYDFLQPPLRRV